MSKILYIERKFDEFVSIEKVFRQIAKTISENSFEVDFQKLTYNNSLSGIIKNLLFYRKKSADIFHITGHIHYIALVLPAKNTILTIHDLRILHTRKGLRRYILKKLFLDLPLKKIKYVTAISEATKREIVANTSCKEEKIRVIENPLHESFYSLPPFKEFNEDCPEILQIGTMENKNIPNLVKALNGIRCKLKIIGRLDESQLAILKENNISYENKIGLNDSEMISEYQSTDIVAFCSTYEGFGLPIIEAQAMRKPLITSDISPMKEVSGGGCYLANPFDVSSLKEGFLKIINDGDFREKIIEKGIKNVERFNPRNISGKYETLYREILAGNN